MTTRDSWQRRQECPGTHDGPHIVTHLGIFGICGPFTNQEFAGKFEMCGSSLRPKSNLHFYITDFDDCRNSFLITFDEGHQECLIVVRACYTGTGEQLLTALQQPPPSSTQKTQEAKRMHKYTQKNSFPLIKNDSCCCPVSRFPERKEDMGAIFSSTQLV